MTDTSAKPAKRRPYWHVDAKWLSAMLLLVALVGTLPVVALYRATSATSGPKLIAYVMAGMVSPEGIDSVAGLQELKAKIKKSGSQTLNFGGVPVTITAADADQLTPRELRLKVVGGFSEKFYQQGPRQLATQQGATQAGIEKAESDATFLRPLTKEGHDALGRVLLWLGLADVLLLGLLVFFSHRVGRLVSPGVVLFLVGLPGLLFTAIASQPAAPVVTGRGSDSESVTGQLGAFAGFLVPLVIKDFANVYIWALAVGAGLLFAAAVWRLVLGLRHRFHSKA